MKRPATVDRAVLDAILRRGPAALPIEERLACLEMLRTQSPEQSRGIDQFLLEQHGEMEQGLRAAEQNLAKIRAVMEKLTAPPWFPAIFIAAMPTPAGERALVQWGNTRRVVTVAEEVDLNALRAGEEVFLSNELNVVTGLSPYGLPRCGETALFDRKTADGRLVLKWRDDELVVDSAEALRQVDLKLGAVIRFDRNCWMAFERLEATPGQEFLLDEVPHMSRDQIGGQDDNYETLQSTLTTILVSPAKARTYELSGRNSILLVGPPGCGKTLMTRIAASEVSRLSGRKCRFGVVKPAAWESPWVGTTQKAIRDTFKALADAAQDSFAILFLDEIESIGRTRGGLANVHSDKFLAALLAELNGFEDRKDVAIIAATNRKDLVDPALLERLSDVEVRVTRPDLRAARAIFKIHLPATLPFSPNGELAAATHQEIIETAISRFYAPNADNAVCKLRFRDGKERTIHARELVSGRFFEQVCRSARRRAFLRDVRGGEPGIQLADMEEAVAEALQRLRSLLTLHNAHAYLSDLPQDVDVVSVEPVVRRVPNARRYLNLDPI